MNASEAITSLERRRLLSLAYGYLGTIADSEDIVQEALLRLTEADRAAIQNSGAWLTRVVTNLAIDKLRSASHRREVYPGEWLPEPLFNAPDAEEQAIINSRLSVGLLYLLEKLEPEQRVVFVLREVFDYPYSAIALLLGKSEAACRQLMVRGRTALGGDVPAPSQQPDAEASLLEDFIQALSQGDEAQLLRILAPGVILIGDGGGKAPSVLNQLHGSSRVVRFFLGLRRKLGSFGDFTPALVNNRPGALVSRENQLVSVTTIDVEGGRIAAIYSVNNPEKLRGHWTKQK